MSAPMVRNVHVQAARREFATIRVANLMQARVALKLKRRRRRKRAARKAKEEFA